MTPKEESRVLSGELAPLKSEAEIEAARVALAERLSQQTSGRYSRVILAALSSIPWIGSLLSAAATYQGDLEQGQHNELHRLWLEEHRAKLEGLARTLASIVDRFDSLGDEIEDRVTSPEYLNLVRQAFRSWDSAATDEKRDFIRKLLTNAGGTKLCSDDLVRLFISWIDLYHESHFAVIRAIYREPGSTRARIWESIHGGDVREDSAEADLFKLLVRDLSTGGVIRQQRATNAYGEYLRKSRPAARSNSPTMKSAFDDVEAYELTELGRQFVHYMMNELVPRVET